jgi:hypothetical protein
LWPVAEMTVARVGGRYYWGSPAATVALGPQGGTYAQDRPRGLPRAPPRLLRAGWKNLLRALIQIAADPSYLYALCNDGQIFRLVNHVWQPMAPIPEDDQPETGSRPRPGFLPIADEPGG